MSRNLHSHQPANQSITPVNPFTLPSSGQINRQAECIRLACCHKVTAVMMANGKFCLRSSPNLKAISVVPGMLSSIPGHNLLPIRVLLRVQLDSKVANVVSEGLRGGLIPAGTGILTSCSCCLRLHQLALDEQSPGGGFCKQAGNSSLVSLASVTVVQAPKALSWSVISKGVGLRCIFD